MLFLIAAKLRCHMLTAVASLYVYICMYMLYIHFSLSLVLTASEVNSRSSTSHYSRYCSHKCTKFTYA